jgi:hypothetical protein
MRGRSGLRPFFICQQKAAAPDGAAPRENIFSRSRDKIILQAKKTYAPDFRRDAQPLRLTRDKFPRTLREVFGRNSYGERTSNTK